MSNPIELDAAGRTEGQELIIGLTAVVIAFAVSGIIASLNTRMLNRGAGQVSQSQQIIATLEEVLSLMKDAETGQRGYLITDDNRYLDPYMAATARIGQRLDEVEQLIADHPRQRARLPAVKDEIAVKLNELQQTIALQRTQGFEAAKKRVETDRGKAAMDAVRTQIGLMIDDEQARRAARLEEMGNAYWLAMVSGIVTGVLGVVLSAFVAHLARRSLVARRRQQWLQAGQIGINEALAGDQRLEQLGESVLGFLARYLDAHAGAFFASAGGEFRRVATWGVPAENGVPDSFAPGDGLLGRAVRDKRTLLIRDVPEGYLTIGSALGRGKPRHLVIAPAITNNVVNGVLEIGFFHPLDALSRELLDRCSEWLGVAVRSANYRTHLQELIEETQRQSEELLTQSEELRVSNEDLEEQSHALKESQTRLELQQAELEQTNNQLQQQADLLEAQRDELAGAKDALQAHARELAQANRFKSEFLANMSHELRTPLNSSLILAKLLADNPDGNLSAEQVQYAETIRSAGNDLLALINEVLDLSKIEAGRMEIHPEPVRLDELLEDLGRTFQPVAMQKGLALRTCLLPGCPEVIRTDRQRLDQVLKNLLSNAIKFTDSGSVALEVGRAAGGRIAFAVADTGIGIAREQQGVVFEAFRQADGTTNRKYGGTGLGLSIARELTRRLGGEIHLESEPGRGSTFTITIPEDYQRPFVAPVAAAAAPSWSALDGAYPAPAPAPAPAKPVPSPMPVPVTAPAGRASDDRDRLTGDGRILLVIEDDEPFARILFELAHELNFQCLLARTAEDGQAMALQYLPSAVVLDIGLPDHSGLSVLDRLKHDARTRHIPVHVVSAGDHTETAMSLGAVGYMLKPVQREDLVRALQQLETRLDHRMRRVLVVEDDPVQRDGLTRLLGSHEVQTVGVGTAADCLEQLKGSTFDCMVLDLALPDASGYSLLETLSDEESLAFPPVIVYTGSDLAERDEERLRRYSKSIIIKGAKSPERLLDEVTLFLHQVVSNLPPEQQRMLEKARSRDAALEGRRVLVVEDDVRNIFALTSVLEPRGAAVQIARNGREALEALERSRDDPRQAIDLVLMDVMMPEMDGLTAAREIRRRPEWKSLPVIMLTAKAMKDDQEHCLAAGANDYMAKPLDVEKLLSLIRVWMRR